MPAATAFQAKLYGLVVSVPIRVEPLKNSTLVSVRAGEPPVQVAAVALRVKLAGALVTVLLAGAVRLTVGDAGQVAAKAILLNKTLVNTVLPDKSRLKLIPLVKPVRSLCHRPVTRFLLFRCCIQIPLVCLCC